jgi:hypothetical protein
MIHTILGIYVDNKSKFYLSHIHYTNSNLYHLCYIYIVLFYLFTLCDIGQYSLKDLEQATRKKRQEDI